MLKRTVSMMLAIISVLSLFSCGTENTGKETDTQKEETEMKDTPISETVTEVIAVETEPVNEYECESAWEAVGNMTLGWNLGNTFDSCGDWLLGSAPKAYETAWGNPVTTKDMLRAVKEAGFNAIRMPVTWDDHFDENGVIDEKWLDRVEQVVGYIMELDMYCIINMHHDAGSGGWLRASTKNYEKNGDTYAKLWEQIAERFKNYDEKLLFESVNEILDEESNWNTPSADAAKGLNKYLQRFVDTVRAGGGYNKTRNLVVMTYSGASGSALSGFKMPKDTAEGHLIVEIHNYDLVDFCWRDSWMESVDTWGSKEDTADMDSFFSDISSKMKRLNAPLIIGEWGSEDKENEAERAKHAGYFVQKAKEYGFVTFFWDCGHFALIDRKNECVQRPLIVEAMVNALGDGE